MAYYMIPNVKNFVHNNYLVNYIDVPKGTGKIIPLVIIESVAMCVSYFISIYLFNSLHLTSLQVGKLISVLSLGTCIGSLLSGYLTTKMSIIKVSSLGLFIYAVGFFLLSQVTSFYFLLLIMFLCGLGGVFIMIANLTALIKLAHDDFMKNRIIVLQSVVFNLSLSVCGFFMSYLQADSLRNFFLIFGFVLLITSIFILNSKEEYKLKIDNKKNSVFEINYPALSMILLIIFFYGIIYSLVKIYFPIEAVSRFHNSFYSWIILSANPIMVIFIQPFLIAKLKNKGNIFILSTGAILLGIGYAFFGISTYLIPSLLFIIFATLGEMMCSPITKKIAANSFGYGNEGIGLASWKMTYYFSGIIGAIFIGYVDEAFKTLNIWYICIPLSMAIVICVGCYGFVINKLQTNL